MLRPCCRNDLRNPVSVGLVRCIFRPRLEIELRRCARQLDREAGRSASLQGGRETAGRYQEARQTKEGSRTEAGRKGGRQSPATARMSLRKIRNSTRFSKSSGSLGMILKPRIQSGRSLVLGRARIRIKTVVRSPSRLKPNNSGKRIKNSMSVSRS